MKKFWKKHFQKTFEIKKTFEKKKKNLQFFKKKLEKTWKISKNEKIKKNEKNFKKLQKKKKTFKNFENFGKIFFKKKLKNIEKLSKTLEKLWKKKKDWKKNFEKMKNEEINKTYNVCRVSAPCDCCVELCTAVSGPPTAFPLIGPQCTVGVLTGTHWGAHWYSGRMVSRTKRQHSGCFNCWDWCNCCNCCMRARVDVDFDRFGLYCDAPHIFNCTRAEGSKLRSVQILTFASRPATNLLHMNGSFSTISAAVHVLTSRTFCTCSLELLE